MSCGLVSAAGPPGVKRLASPVCAPDTVPGASNAAVESAAGPVAVAVALPGRADLPGRDSVPTTKGATTLVLVSVQSVIVRVVGDTTVYVTPFSVRVVGAAMLVVKADVTQVVV